MIPTRRSQTRGTAPAIGGPAPDGLLMHGIERRTLLKLGALTAVAGAVAGPLASPARGAGDPAVVGSWSAPFDMGGVAIHTTLMNNGEVLFFQYVEGMPKHDHTSHVNTWDYRTGAIQDASFSYDRDVFCAGHVVLPDGRVYVAGGHDPYTGSKQSAVGSAETDIYDPATRTWTPRAPLTMKRWYPTVISLVDGRVLIFGGEERSGRASPVVDEYTPVTNTMRQLPSSATKVLGNYPRMYLMPNGQVLWVGPAKQSQWFDPATSAWRKTAKMLYGKRTRGNAVLLPGATRVLAVGGQLTGSAAPTATAEIFDSS